MSAQAGVVRRHVFVIALLLIVIGALGGSGYSLFRLREIAIERQFDTAAITARALEDHLSQSFATIDRTLANLDDKPLTAAVLKDALRQAPYLRSISIVDKHDTITVSSNAANVGVKISRDGFLPQAVGALAILRIGRLQVGRDFHEARVATADVDPPDISFLPATRDLPLKNGETVTVAATINSDSFLNFYANHIPPTLGMVHLLRYDGGLLLSTDDAFRPGAVELIGEAFAIAVENEIGHREERLKNGQVVLTAFRASRSYPLMIEVHLDKDKVLAGWRQEAAGTLAIVAVVLLVSLTMATLYFLNLEKAAQQRLLDQERLLTLSRTVEQSPAAIIITDPEGFIEYVNPKFESVTGYKSSEVIGRTPNMLKSGKTSTDEYRALWKTIRSGGIWHGEFHNRRKDGTLFWEQASISPVLSEKGELIQFVAVKEDITEQKRLRDELDQHHQQLERLVEQRTAELNAARQQAEAANVAKSAFLANMSHEIRTPMNGIIGMAHILRREGVSPTQAIRLDNIDAAAGHLLSIINDILDISKIEAGRFSLDETSINIDSLMRNVVSMLSHRAQGKGIQLLVDNGVTLTNLRGDATRLQQALLNYATNAVKFTERGSVTLRTRLIEQAADSALLRFEVQDTGIGLSPDALARVFNAFEQADNSISRKYGGTGLGLTIAKRLAEMMGGEAGADSTLGIGSIFWFTARLKYQADKPVDSPTDLTVSDMEREILQRFSGARILVVDDDPTNREIAKIQIEYAGLIVETAEDGEEAIEKTQPGRYAAILMDMQMPNLDGLEATRRIRQISGCGTIPIIAMTANAFAEDKAQCLAAGMNDFLVKPFHPERLFHVLLTWLSAPDAASYPGNTPVDK